MKWLCTLIMLIYWLGESYFVSSELQILILEIPGTYSACFLGMILFQTFGLKLWVPFCPFL